MPTYAVKRLIAANPQTIWSLLIDASNYPTWNPAVLEEVFSGLLESIISKSIPDMFEAFEQFADGLGQAADGG